ncbi:MAG: hypothetical protein WC364_11005 [Eubacteriales bacterium]|jgi:hypothetical protein
MENRKGRVYMSIAELEQLIRDNYRIPADFSIQYVFQNTTFDIITMVANSSDFSQVTDGGHYPIYTLAPK